MSKVQGFLKNAGAMMRREGKFFVTQESLNETVDKAVTKALVEQREFTPIRGNESTYDSVYPIPVDDDSIVYGTEAEYLQYWRGLKPKEKENVLKNMSSTLLDRSSIWLLETLDRELGWTTVSMAGQVEGADSTRVLSTAILHLLQDALFKRYDIDPICRSGINNVVRYTIGRGIKFDCQSDEIVNWLSDFWIDNGMEDKQKTLVREFLIEGEKFLLYFIDKTTGKVVVRLIPCKEIDLIETHSEDLETILSYKRDIQWGSKQKTYYYPDITYHRLKAYLPDDGKSNYEDKFSPGDDQFVHFIKSGMSAEVRGRPAMRSVLKTLKLFEDFVIDRARLNHERSKVVWIKSIKGGRTGEEMTRERRSPRGGMMMVETDKVTYRIEAAKLESADAKEDGNLLLYTIGSGLTIPLHILFQNAENENYASIRKSDTPFSQMIVDLQDFWGIRFREMFRFALAQGVKYGKLPKTTEVKDYGARQVGEALKFINERVLGGDKDLNEIREEAKQILGEIQTKKVPTEMVPVSIVFPDVVHEDPKKVAEVLKIHAELGLADVSTLSSRAGYDWRVEFNKMAERGQKKKEEETEAFYNLVHAGSGNAPDDLFRNLPE